MKTKPLRKAVLHVLGVTVAAIVAVLALGTLKVLTDGYSDVVFLVGFLIWVGYDKYREAESENDAG